MQPPVHLRYGKGSAPLPMFVVLKDFVALRWLHCLVSGTDVYRAGTGRQVMFTKRYFQAQPGGNAAMSK